MVLRQIVNNVCPLPAVGFMGLVGKMGNFYTHVESVELSCLNHTVEAID